MSTIVAQIEAYLKKIINSAPGENLELRRSDLAHLFGCAPSQINYVLSTRFTPERGFIVETRRGGGGYIRITRLATEYKILLQHMEGCCNEDTLEGFVIRLYEQGFLTKRETLFIREMLRPVLNHDQKQKEIFSAHILKSIAMLLREGL